VYSGGEFGKVFLWNVKDLGKSSRELIDQQQAHKRRIVAIVFSNDYIFTCSLDQKIKQWTLSSYTLKAVFDIDFLPNSISVENATLYVGGRSVLASFELQFFDQPLRYSSHQQQTGIGIVLLSPAEISGMNTVAIIVSVTVTFVVIVLAISGSIFYFSKKPQSYITRETSDNITLDQTTNLRTLVGTVLNISLPLYKEVNSTDFSCTRVIGMGGVGTVYVGQAIKTSCAVYGQTIVVKKIIGIL
jgi:WD40 repeat protein